MKRLESLSKSVHKPEILFSPLTHSRLDDATRQPAVEG